MKTLIIGFILFSCSVAWGEPKWKNDYGVCFWGESCEVHSCAKLAFDNYDYKVIEKINIGELLEEIELLKERIAELENIEYSSPQVLDSWRIPELDVVCWEWNEKLQLWERQ